jgi:hypothetical protein
VKGRAVLPFVLVGVVLVVVIVASRLLSENDESDEDRVPVQARPAASETERPSPPPFRQQNETLDGTGYAFGLPPLWLDTTENAASAPESDRSLDSRSDWGSFGRANVVVLGPFTNLDDDLDALREQQRDNLRTDFNGRIEDVGRREIGGVEALGLRRVRPLGTDFMSDETYWVTKVEGLGYLIISRREAGDSLANDAFEQIYASWTWQVD